MAHIVDGMRLWSPWTYQSEDWLWDQWAEVWIIANGTAATRQQKAMAKELVQLAQSFEEKIRHQEARSDSLVGIERAKILKKSTTELEATMKQMKREAERMLSTAMQKHGFARNENFVYHPDDWFAPQSFKRQSTTVGAIQAVTGAPEILPLADGDEFPDEGTSVSLRA